MLLASERVATDRSNNWSKLLAELPGQTSLFDNVTEVISADRLYVFPTLTGIDAMFWLLIFGDFAHMCIVMRNRLPHDLCVHHVQTQNRRYAELPLRTKLNQTNYTMWYFTLSRSVIRSSYVSEHSWTTCTEVSILIPADQALVHRETLQPFLGWRPRDNRDRHDSLEIDLTTARENSWMEIDLTRKGRMAIWMDQISIINWDMQSLSQVGVYCV